MNDDRDSSVRDMLANYLALTRKAARYWPRATLIFALTFAAGLTWVLHIQRIYKSEASATVFDIRTNNDNGMSSDEAQAALRARLDQVYGSRANLGRIVDELNLYPWLRGRTSHLKIIGSFQDALTYSAAGRDAFHLEFVYQNPSVAQRTVRRLLRLYTDERRAAGQMQLRNELDTVQTAAAGLESALSDQEEHLDRFERANHELVEQVRLQRLGQTVPRAGATATAVFASAEPVASLPGDSLRTRRLRIRLAGLQGRYASLQHSLAAPAETPSAPSAPAEESDHVQSLRRAVSELRDRLARLRTTYTDEYPDVQVAVHRLADAERDLNTALAAEHSRSHSNSAPVASVSPAEVRLQLGSVIRDIDDTRAALAASARDDRAHPTSETQTPAPSPSNTRPAPERRAARAASAPRSTTTAAPVADGANASGERSLGSLVEVEAAWDRLMAELVATRTRYQQILARKFELEAQLETVNTTGADVLRVIDPPSLPSEPEPPGRTKLAAIVLALALALSLGVALLSGYLDSRLYSPADLRRWGELPDLPPIPDLREYRTTASRRGAEPRPADAQA